MTNTSRHNMKSYLDLVVAVTSSTAASDERWGYRRQLFDLLARHVLEQVD